MYPHDRIPNKEWLMCSSSEAQERASCNELSIFEYSSDPDERRKPDPYRCVKKYRRSAAGGGISRHEIRLRLLDELEMTVWYLLGGVFTRQRPPYRQGPSCLHSTKDAHTRHSLCHTVNFIDDRIRAVQVDLTILMGRATQWNPSDIGRIRRFQAMIVRYHLISQYFLFSNPRHKKLDYEWKFAVSALRTSLISYLDTYRYHTNVSESSHREEKDEIMSYVALLHIAAVVRCQENSFELSNQSSDRPCGILIDDGDGLQALLSFLKKYETLRPDEQLSESCPKFWFVLQVAVAIDQGNFLEALSMLTNDDDRNDDRQAPLSSFYHSGMEPILDSKLKIPLSSFKRWKILARCCVGQIIPFIYVFSLRQYIKAFMKEEKVSVDDIRKLLCISSGSIVLDLCRVLGLPISTTNDKSFICMKKLALSFQSTEAVDAVKYPCRSTLLDPFVFGGWASAWFHEHKQSNPVVDLTDQVSQLSLGDATRDWGTLEATVDEQGILIPPSPVLWECIRN